MSDQPSEESKFNLDARIAISLCCKKATFTSRMECPDHNPSYEVLKKEVEGWKKEGQRLQGIEGDYLRSFLENESLKSKLKIAREALKEIIKAEKYPDYDNPEKDALDFQDIYKRAEQVLEQIGEKE